MRHCWIPCEAGYGLQLGTLSVSFQRYELPSTGLVHAIPRSLGALPVAKARRGQLLLPVDEREAFWIGLSSREEIYRIDLRALLSDGTYVQLGERAQSVPPIARIVGWPATEVSYHALSKAGADSTLGIATIHLWAQKIASRSTGWIEGNLTMVDYAEYSLATLRPAPEPLDPSAGYRGHLLP